MYDPGMDLWVSGYIYCGKSDFGYVFDDTQNHSMSGLLITFEDGLILDYIGYTWI